MKLRANACGTWPGGVHWTKDEVRDIDVPEDAALPGFLAEVKTKAKAKGKKPAEPVTDAE